MFNQTIVSFPGLGIEPIELNKIAFTLVGVLAHQRLGEKSSREA